jgi:hypothetical protein
MTALFETPAWLRISDKFPNLGPTSFGLPDERPTPVYATAGYRHLSVGVETIALLSVEDDRLEGTFAIDFFTDDEDRFLGVTCVSDALLMVHGDASTWLHINQRDEEPLSFLLLQPSDEYDLENAPFPTEVVQDDDLDAGVDEAFLTALTSHLVPLIKSEVFDARGGF